MNNLNALFKIDGTKIEGCVLAKEDFIKKFHELGTLMTSDCQNFWVLYEETNAFPWSVGQYSETFWCIPVSAIEFIRIDGEWHHMKNELTEMLDSLFGGVGKEPSPVGVSGTRKVSGVTLDEDYGTLEKKIEAEVEYNRLLTKFDSFESAFASYVLFDKRADEDNFKVWKAIQEWVNTPTNKDVSDDNKMCLMTYLENEWGAWTDSILFEEYKYMNLTKIVWDSWAEQ